MAKTRRKVSRSPTGFRMGTRLISPVPSSRTRPISSKSVRTSWQSPQILRAKREQISVHGAVDGIFFFFCLFVKTERLRRVISFSRWPEKNKTHTRHDSTRRPRAGTSVTSKRPPARAYYDTRKSPRAVVLVRPGVRRDGRSAAAAGEGK